MNEYLDQDAWNRALRRRRIRSPRVVAKLAGFSGSYGNFVAGGLLPPMETRERFARVLGVSASELWKEVPEPQ